MAGETLIADLDDIYQTLFEKRLQSVWEKEFKHSEFAFERKLTNTGSARLARVEKIARTAVSTKSEGVPSSFTAHTTNYVEVTLEQFGVAVRITDIALNDTITGDMIKLSSDRIGMAMAEASDYRMQKEIANTSSRIRCGLDSDYIAHGTAASGTTTSLVGTSIAGVYADDFFNGSTITVLNGTNKGLSRKVTDFVGASGTFTTAAFPKAIDSTSEWVCHSISGIDGSFKLDSDSVLKTTSIAMSRGCKPISGQYMWILDAFARCDFFSDELFREQSINIPNSRFQNYSIGQWFNGQFLRTDQAYLENSSGAEDASTGTIIPISMIGAMSYSIARWSKGKGKTGMETFIINKPDHTNHDMSYVTLSAKMRFAPVVVNSEWIYSVACGYNRLY